MLRAVLGFVLGVILTAWIIANATVTPWEQAAHMSCNEALSEPGSAAAARSYSASVGGDISQLHRYLVASGFYVIGVGADESGIALSYRFKPGWAQPCLRRRMMAIDGTMLGVRLGKDGLVEAVRD